MQETCPPGGPFQSSKSLRVRFADGRGGKAGGGTDGASAEISARQSARQYDIFRRCVSERLASSLHHDFLEQHRVDTARRDRGVDPPRQLFLEPIETGGAVEIRWPQLAQIGLEGVRAPRPIRRRECPGRLGRSPSAKLSFRHCGPGEAGSLFAGGHDKAEAAASAAGPQIKPVVFLDMPDVLVNLSSTGGSERTQYLKVKVTLELPNEAMSAQIQPVMPRLMALPSPLRLATPLWMRCARSRREERRTNRRERGPARKEFSPSRES
jgi:hypothetical protein